MILSTKSKKISIQIVTWNSLRFIPSCLDSIFNQIYRNFSVLVIDNASTDGTIKFVEQNYPTVKIIKNSKNLGFSKAHNQGILMTESEYVLVMNPDIILEPDFLKKIVEAMDNNKMLGTCAGKLLKVRFGEAEIREVIKTNIIDSTGLIIKKSRQTIDRGEGEEDRGQYDRTSEIFGTSGACVLYRRAALEDIKLITGHQLPISNYEYFDEDFFTYKEDIDLAWRLRLRGWGSVYIPIARAYHFRAVSIAKRLSHPPLVNFLSYRNHLWLLLKNDYWLNFLSHFLFIFWYQLAKELYLLFTQPFTLVKGSLAFWQKFGKMHKKRKYILKNAKIKAREIKQWFI